ncbi:unnamed protein product [Peniophora sp. CBMAI 1063]|nr:unnamed protein product [Peniophora sp. CBMAI 1063]
MAATVRTHPHSALDVQLPTTGMQTRAFFTPRTGPLYNLRVALANIRRAVPFKPPGAPNEDGITPPEPLSGQRAFLRYIAVPVYRAQGAAHARLGMSNEADRSLTRATPAQSYCSQERGPWAMFC